MQNGNGLTSVSARRSGTDGANGNGSANGHGGMTDAKGRVNVEPALCDWRRKSDINLALQELGQRLHAQNIAVVHSNPPTR